MPSYEEDRGFSDFMMPTVQAIVGRYVLKPAPVDVDQKLATDLMLFRAEAMMIAARVRKAKGDYARRYPWEITIRSDRPTGARTEFAKVFEDGFGDWMFYGHQALADSDLAQAHRLSDRWGSGGISRWFLVNLHALREAYGHGELASSISRERENPDGTRFIPVDLRGFSYAVIQSHPEMPQQQGMLFDEISRNHA